MSESEYGIHPEIRDLIERAGGLCTDEDGESSIPVLAGSQIQEFADLLLDWVEQFGGREPAANSIESVGDGPWYESMAELAAVYGEMCAINETPRSQQTPQQTQRLNELRSECVAIHGRRIAMNMSRNAAPVERELIGITQAMRERTPEEQAQRIANGLAWLDSLKAAQMNANDQTALEEISNEELFNLLPTIQFRDEKPLPAVWLTRRDAYAFARAAIKFLRQADAGGCSEPPAAPPECKTEAERTAFAFGWFKALEANRLKQQCWCATCRPVTPQDMRFVVCPDCGNKRCPKANDHRNTCTGSNDVGQAGSSWEHVKPNDHAKGSNE